MSPAILTTVVAVAVYVCGGFLVAGVEMFKADIKPDSAEAAQGAAAAVAAAGVEGSSSKGKSSYTGVSWNDRNQRFEVGGWSIAQGR